MQENIQPINLYIGRKNLPLKIECMSCGAILHYNDSPGLYLGKCPNCERLIRVDIKEVNNV